MSSRPRAITSSTTTSDEKSVLKAHFIDKELPVSKDRFFMLSNPILQEVSSKHSKARCEGFLSNI